jgi:hypothetical protein
MNQKPKYRETMFVSQCTESFDDFVGLQVHRHARANRLIPCSDGVVRKYSSCSGESEVLVM